MVDIIIFDHFAIPLTNLIAKIRFITPNQVTIVSGIFGLTSAYFYFKNQLFLGALLMFISFVLDCVDGNLARKTGRTSPLGAKLDAYTDSIKKVASIGALVYISEWNIIYLVMLVIGHYLLLKLFPTKYPEDYKEINFSSKNLEPVFEPYDLMIILLLFGPLINFEFTLLFVILIQLYMGVKTRRLKTTL